MDDREITIFIKWFLTFDFRIVPKLSSPVVGPALFPGLQHLQSLVACSMQLWRGIPQAFHFLILSDKYRGEGRLGGCDVHVDREQTGSLHHLVESVKLGDGFVEEGEEEDKAHEFSDGHGLGDDLPALIPDSLCANRYQSIKIASRSDLARGQGFVVCGQVVREPWLLCQPNQRLVTNGL